MIQCPDMPQTAAAVTEPWSDAVIHLLGTEEDATAGGGAWVGLLPAFRCCLLSSLESCSPRPRMWTEQQSSSSSNCFSSGILLLFISYSLCCSKRGFPPLRSEGSPLCPKAGPATSSQGFQGSKLPFPCFTSRWHHLLAEAANE